MSELQNVKFLPWVGKDYKNGLQVQDGKVVFGDGTNHSKKIMVLGENLYFSDASKAVQSFTSDILHCYFNPNGEFEGWMNSYTKFIRALSGDFDLSRNASEEWWNHILFYNFVQILLTGSHFAPNEKNYRDSDTAFFEVLEQFEPDFIFVWGNRLYNMLPNKGHKGESISVNDKEDEDIVDTWNYTNGNHTTHVIPISHPAVGFDTEYWHRVFFIIFNEYKDGKFI